MSDQATLFLLKDKLERVRKARRNSVIGVFALVIISALLWNGYGLNFTIGLILAVVLATVATMVINGYYGKQEIAVLKQIENMSRGSGY